MMKLLLDSGAFVDAQDKNGETAINLDILGNSISCAAYCDTSE